MTHAALEPQPVAEALAAGYTTELCGKYIRDLLVQRCERDPSYGLVPDYADLPLSAQQASERLYEHLVALGSTECLELTARELGHIVAGACSERESEELTDELTDQRVVPGIALLTGVGILQKVLIPGPIVAYGLTPQYRANFMMHQFVWGG